MQENDLKKTSNRKSKRNSNPNIKTLKTPHHSKSIPKNTLTKKPMSKSRYMIKHSHLKQNNMSKASFATPYDPALYLSHFVTPQQRSSVNHSKIFNQLRNGNHHKSPPQKTQQMKFGGDGGVQFTFYIQDKKFKKNYPRTASIQRIKAEVAQLMAQNFESSAYFALVKFITIDGNAGLQKLINNDHVTINEIEQKYGSSIIIKPLFSKSSKGYSEGIQINDFSFLKYVGSGGFSQVYLGRCKIDGVLCALKFIKKDSIISEKKAKMIENQRQILFTINHPRLVDMFYMIESRNYIIFGLEYCPGGNLYQCLQERTRFPEQQAKYLFFQILQGLSYLHSQNILFRDIKLENILFDEQGNIKITDFGLSKPDIAQEEVTYSYCGSPEYMAPEMLAKCGHTFQIDHYALGIILYELLYGKSPFFAPRKQDIFDAIFHSEPYFPINVQVSKEAISLMKGLLEKNPKYRIGSLKGTSQIFSHPWLRGYSATQIDSPFKKPLSDYSVTCSREQMSRIELIVKDQISNKNFNKKNFKNNYVSEVLSQNLKENIVVLNKKVKKKKERLNSSFKRGKSVEILSPNQTVTIHDRNFEKPLKKKKNFKN